MSATVIRPAGPQHAEDLPVHPNLVGAQIDDPVRDDNVSPAILDGKALDQAFAELDVRQPKSRCHRPAALEHLVYRLWRDSGYAVGTVAVLTGVSGLVVAFRMRETTR